MKYGSFRMANRGVIDGLEKQIGLLTRASNEMAHSESDEFKYFVEVGITI